jgi:hypothetical protein
MAEPKKNAFDAVDFLAKAGLGRQRVKTVTHIVECLSLAQNFRSYALHTGFPESLRRGELQVG